MNEIKLVGEWGRVQFYQVPGYEGYAVSRCGKVRSLSRRTMRSNGRPCSRKGIELKTGSDRDGYPIVSMSGHKTIAVHRLIASTFIGCIEGKEIDHIDRDPTNNHAENLRITTRSGNMQNREAKGCHFHKRDRKWYASIMIRRKNIHLGSFKKEADARAAYEKAKLDVLGWVPQ